MEARAQRIVTEELKEEGWNAQRLKRERKGCGAKRQ